MSGIVFAKNSGLNNEVFGKSAEPIKAIIVQGVESWEEKSLIDKIFYMDTTENFAEKYATMTAVGNFKNVGENGATPKSSMQMGFVKVIEPDTWKNSLEISAEMMEDEKLGDVKNAARRFTQSFGRTRENFAATLLANGTETTMVYDGVLYEIACADGTPMFNTAHPSKTQGTKYVQSNLFKGELNEENFDLVQEKMQGFTDDDGHKLNIQPDTIIIPNVGSQKRKLFALVGSELDPESNNNAWNFQCGLWNVLVWNELPNKLKGGNYFFMADSNYLQDYECMPFLDRIKLKITQYIDNNTDAHVFKGRSRFGAGFNNWRGISLCGENVDGTDLAALLAEE